MQVVILHESLTGNTEQAARLIANVFYDRQIGGQGLPGRRLRTGRGGRGRPGGRRQLDRRALPGRPEARPSARSSVQLP